MTAVGMIWVIAFIAVAIGGYEIWRRVSYQADYTWEDDDKDAWEGGFWEANDPKRVAAHLKFDYTDTKGARTERSVQVREFDESLHGGLMLAHCELRDDTRTFRLSKIRGCIDLETGELVDDVRAYLNQKYEESPERAMETLATEYVDVLKTLYFLCKADGQFRRNEKAIVSEYLGGLIQDDRITPDLIDQALRELDIPSLQGFKIAVGRALKSGQVDPERFVACCKAIVGSQKTVHPAEANALEYIENRTAKFQASGE